ncbi:MAG: phage baseplate assembly protein V, partial [Chlamydiota bacterium]
MTASLMDRMEARFYGKYRAFVADNADQENRGRLRLRIPDVLGNDVVSGWALPCAPYGGTAGQGFFYIPDKDAGVWVEFEQGNLDYPIWVGTFWA